jgi:hypothetical protein
VRPRNPPKLAQFLLKHLARGSYPESLQGDLMEEWHAGRSALWYWRQVSIALALTGIQSLRVLAFPVALAVAVLFGVSAATQLPTHSVIGWARSLEHHTVVGLNGYYYSRVAAKLLRSAVILVWLFLPLLAQGVAIQALWGRRGRATAFIAGLMFFMLSGAGEFFGLLYTFSRGPTLALFSDLTEYAMPMLKVAALLLGTVMAQKLWIFRSRSVDDEPAS